ncbi:hypothetical protein B2G71_12375 [Novosphingobium sp. PC22D]|nr:hypothetical protein B2G71_12375 [Novosphingobium sp. PC22D]
MKEFSENTNAADETHETVSGEEQRGAPRFALLLRTAKLVSPHGEFLCIVRDVSEGGVKLRLFHGLPAGSERYHLELASGDQFAVDLVWIEGDEAGFQFADTVDVDTFVAEASPFPKRPIRLRVEAEAFISIGGRQITARLRDLSRQGARIESSEKLALGQTIHVVGPHLPQLQATVCWRRSPEYGLVFTNILQMGELAQRVAAIQTGSHPDDRAVA